MQRIFRFAFLVSAIAIATTTGASAQTPSDGEDEAARYLYERGLQSYEAGDFPAALQRFQQAYDLSHRPELLYNIGHTLDRLRRDSEALATFERFLVERPDSPRRPEVEGRIASMRAALDAERQAAEAAELERREELARIERARLEAEQQAEAARRDAEAAARRAQAAEADRGLPRAIFISLAGSAVAAGALGIGFGIRTRSLNDDYVAAVSDAPLDGDGRRLVSADELAQIQGLHDDAESAQRVANIGLFTGAALAVGAGVTALFTNWKGHTDADARAEALPLFSASHDGGLVGMQLRF